jgi:DNA-binding HxlR family transcriptional regulator
MVRLDDCAVAATMKVIGGKWVPLIVFHLRHQPRRYNALRRLMPEVTQRILTLQLRALERDGVVSRQVYAGKPPAVEYRLTARGLALAPIMDAMEAWGGADAARRPARSRGSN